MGRPEKQSVALSKKWYHGAIGVGEKEGKGDRRRASTGVRGCGERSVQRRCRVGVAVECAGYLLGVLHWRPAFLPGPQSCVGCLLDGSSYCQGSQETQIHNGGSNIYSVGLLRSYREGAVPGSLGTKEVLTFFP